MDVKFFKCMHCGNVAIKVFDQGVPMSCCGEAMAELTANSTDGAFEKHVPQVTVDGANVHVQVGEVAHPMTEEHYIEWIALATADRVDIRYLKPGDEPAALFPPAQDGTVYAYCNLHGLWKAEF